MWCIYQTRDGFAQAVRGSDRVAGVKTAANLEIDNPKNPNLLSMANDDKEAMYASRRDANGTIDTINLNLSEEQWLALDSACKGGTAKLIVAFQASSIRSRTRGGTLMSGRLAVFAGSTPNIGTSLTAFGTAYRIAALTGRKVGYLCLNLKSAKTHLYLGVDKPDVTLEGVRPELRAGTLTGDKLSQYAFAPRGLGGLHVLFGNMAREQAEYYEPEDMLRLLAASREAFDLTIADVSAYWDNAATVCAMKEADDRFLVTTDSLSHFQEDIHRWTGQVGSQFGMSPEQFQLVLSTSQSNEGGFRMKEIRKETGCTDYANYGYWRACTFSWTAEDWMNGSRRRNGIRRRSIRLQLR